MTVIPSQFGTISKLLDATQLRHRAISQNVANVNTPGYRRIDVKFEEELAKQLGNEADAGTIAQLSPTVHEVDGLPSRPDGNNVDIDKEMGALNKNALIYQVYTQVLASKMGMMRSAITGQ